MRKTFRTVVLAAIAAAGLCAESTASVAIARRAGDEHTQAREDKAAGRVIEAEAHYLKALQFWDEAGPEYLSAKCMTLMNLGELHRELRRMDEAEKELRDASAIALLFRSAYPHQYPDVLSRLGALYGLTEKPERGRPLLNEAIALFKQQGPEVYAELAYAYNSLAMINVGDGLLSEGEANLREAVRLSELPSAADRRETLSYQNNLALALIFEKQFDRAETLLKYVEAGVESLPVVPQQLLGTVYSELSSVALNRNKLAIAEDYALRGLAAMQRESPPDPLALALARVNLANIYIRQHRAKDAESILPGAVAEERRLGANPQVLGNALRRLAELRALEQSWGDSGMLYREAIGLYQNAFGPENPEIKSILRDYSSVLKRGGGPKSL